MAFGLTRKGELLSRQASKVDTMPELQQQIWHGDVMILVLGGSSGRWS